MTCLKPEEIMKLIPQQKPFRFIDHISEVGANHICGHYRFRKDEPFYQGHFPQHPVTPGVILLEAMCQTGVVALGIYLLCKELGPEETAKWTTMFSDAETEFFRPVYPGQEVSIRARKIFWRRKKLRAEAEMHAADGGLTARATISGIGVRQL